MAKPKTTLNNDYPRVAAHKFPDGSLNFFYWLQTCADTGKFSHQTKILVYYKGCFKRGDF
jgi:hypothetical protein